MTSSKRISLGIFAAACCNLLASVPAQAGGIDLAAGQISGVLQMAVVSQNLCVNYTYDANGNRITQSNADVSTAPATWGASTFPCFIWGN